MNIKEKDRIECAIRHIESSLDVAPWARDIAVESMEKQIPQKPKHINKNKEFDGNWEKVCPRCGRVLIERITTSEYSYPRCYNMSGFCLCGQAIDWEEGEGRN